MQEDLAVKQTDLKEYLDDQIKKAQADKWFVDRDPYKSKKQPK